MKKIFAIIIVLTVFISVAPAFASGHGGDGNNNRNNNNQEQNQEQSQGLVFAPQSNNNRSLGSLPFTAPHGIGTAEFPLNDYGHFVTQFSLRTSVQFMRVLTSQEVKTIKEVNDAMEGAEKWERRDRKIIPSPIIKRIYKGSGDGRGYFIDPKEFVEKILPRLRDEHIMGIMLYNSKLNKENPVNVPHFQVRAFEDLSPLGANVFVPVDQFFQGYFVPEGFEFSISGILSWISKSFLNGGAVSPSVGVAKQQNTEFGRPGAAFVACSVPIEILFPPKPVEPPKVVNPPVPEKSKCDESKIREQIREFEQKCKSCTRFCFDNLGFRANLGDLYVDLYTCIGDKENLKKAIKEYEIAERNYLNGYDINSNKVEANGIIAKVYYNQAGCMRELYGRETAMSFARDKKLERIPTGFVSK